MTAIEPTSSFKLTIDGNHFDDIAGFYAELNRILMSEEDWQLGESLDALNDLLYCGYGAMKGSDSVVIRWLHSDKSRRDLGIAATRAWLEAKLSSSGSFNIGLVQRQLAALEDNSGRTYFELLLEVIEEHPRVSALSCEP